MTVNDLLKRLKPEDYDKVIILGDSNGWSNISGRVDVWESTVSIFADYSRPFSDEG